MEEMESKSRQGFDIGGKKNKIENGEKSEMREKKRKAGDDDK